MVNKIKQYGKQVTAALRVRNFRLYFAGQSASLIGTWIQLVAQTWLILQLTGSATMVGLLAAMQFLPVLLFGVYGGVIVDRFDKRRLLLVCQAILMLLSLVTGWLVDHGQVSVGLLFGAAGLSGVVAVVDNPARQTFLSEMVGPRLLLGAISLSSIMTNLTRIVGPAIAAILIARVGMAECFYLNAASFGLMTVCLVAMRKRELKPAVRSTRLRGQLVAGLRYVRRTPVLRDVLVMMALVGTLTYEFPVVLPVLASMTFSGDAGSYALLTAAFSLGAVIGGLVLAARPARGLPAFVVSAGLFAVAMTVTAFMPSLYSAALALVAVGLASMCFMSLGNAILQLRCQPGMRGRVMALWAVAFLGSTPIGGPLIGWICQQYGPRWGLLVGGLAAGLAGLYGLRRLHRAVRPVKPAAA